MAINLPSGWTSNLTSNGGTISIPKNEETEDKTYRITVKALYDEKELDSKTCDVTLKGENNDCEFSDLPEAIEITVNGTFPECNNATRTWSGTAYLDSDSLEMAQAECQEGDGSHLPYVIYHYDTAPGSGNYIEYNGDEFIGTFYVSKTTNGMFGISGSISGSLPCSGPVDGYGCNERSTSFGGEIADITVSDLSGGLTLEASCGCAYCEDLTGGSGGECGLPADSLPQTLYITVALVDGTCTPQPPPVSVHTLTLMQATTAGAAYMGSSPYSVLYASADTGQLSWSIDYQSLVPYPTGCNDNCLPYSVNGWATIVCPDGLGDGYYPLKKGDVLGGQVNFECRDPSTGAVVNYYATYKGTISW